MRKEMKNALFLLILETAAAQFRRTAIFLKKEFRVIIVKTIQDLRKTVGAETERIQEIHNKDLEDIKNKQMKNTITEK